MTTHAWKKSFVFLQCPSCSILKHWVLTTFDWILYFIEVFFILFIELDVLWLEFLYLVLNDLCFILFVLIVTTAALEVWALNTGIHLRWSIVWWLEMLLQYFDRWIFLLLHWEKCTFSSSFVKIFGGICKLGQLRSVIFFFFWWNFE